MFAHASFSRQRIPKPQPRILTTRGSNRNENRACTAQEKRRRSIKIGAAVETAMANDFEARCNKTASSAFV
jgi:hypothetical protein